MEGENRKVIKINDGNRGPQLDSIQLNSTRFDWKGNKQEEMKMKTKMKDTPPPLPTHKCAETITEKGLGSGLPVLSELRKPQHIHLN